MRRPFFATSLILMLSAGTALASDPLTLLSTPADMTKKAAAAETSSVPSLTVTADVKQVVAQPESVAEEAQRRRQVADADHRVQVTHARSVARRAGEPSGRT